jgi:acyl-CoA thioesterase FadM
MEQKNNVFVCRHAELNYLSPALLDDEVNIHIQITEQGKASLTFVYEITSGLRVGPDGNEIRLVTGSTKMVSCKSRDGQVVPTRIAPWVQERLAKKAK